GPWTPLVDMGVYGLHTVTGIMGPAQRLTAFCGIAFGHRTFANGGTMTFSEGGTREVDITSADNGIVMLDWGEGRLGTVDGAFTMIQRVGPSLQLFGQKGVITSAGRQGTFRLYLQEQTGPYPKGWSEVNAEGAVVATGDTQPGGQTAARGPRERGPSEDIRHWAEVILEGKPLILTPQHARHVVEIMEKAPIASETGQAQELTTTF